jgi:uncharacterized membrane protein
VVTTQYDDHDRTRRFLIRPNRSLSWPLVVRFYLVMVAVSMGIGATFALRGAWMVLPFAGLEMLVLGGALYVVARRGTHWQMVAIHDDLVEITDHRHGFDQRETFKRAWVQVELSRPAFMGHPTRLTLGSHGRRVEIGVCLNDDDRRYLADELAQAVRST